jgi:hypothetical protein
MKLIDERTSDGSRLFGRLPKTAGWQRLRDHVAALPGAEIVNFVNEGIAPAWFDFVYSDHRFVVRNGGDSYCFLVAEPGCSEVSLYQVGTHCETLLGTADE